MATAPPYIANFDSTSAMLRGLGRYLRGKEFAGLGFTPTALEPVGRLLNKLPKLLREEFYIWSGWSEAVRKGSLGSVSAERVARWMVSEYPRRPYPAIAIGSSGGAMIHLCAALGIPWLPQTFLIPVRRHGIHPDEPRDDMEWGREPGRALLQANPELQLHHMNDANQDRLMIQHMTYFRVKRLRLGETFERFITENLPPGGTIFVSDCTLKWPTVKIAERHYFQHGALGGATPEEFHHGSPRVAEYLERYGSHRRHWDSPATDSEAPEAEWGFEETLLEDIESLARRRGYRVRRIVHGGPEKLSPLVADLYRWWYRKRNLIANRLLVGSFIVMEPYWTLRTASVPFWMTFNKEPSLEWLQKYLDEVDPFDEIYMMLFSHGVDSVGLVPIEEWRKVLRQARKHGNFIGVDEQSYPRDFSIYVRYNQDLQRQIAARYPMPGPLALDQLDEFLAQAPDRYPVEWLEQEPAGVA